MTDEKKPRKSPVAKAREAEAADDDLLLMEVRGVELRLPIRNIPIRVMDVARSGGDSYDVTKALIGEAQWKALSDAGAGSRDIAEIEQKYAEASGGN